MDLPRRLRGARIAQMLSDYAALRPGELLRPDEEPGEPPTLSDDGRRAEPAWGGLRVSGPLAAEAHPW